MPITRNMQLAMNIVTRFHQSGADMGNDNCLTELINLTAANANYKETGDLKDLELFKEHIKAMNGVFVDALQDWEKLEKEAKDE